MERGRREGGGREERREERRYGEAKERVNVSTPNNSPNCKSSFIYKENNF